MRTYYAIKNFKLNEEKDIKHNKWFLENIIEVV